MRPFNILVHSTGANNPWLKRYVDAPEVLGLNKYGNHWNKATATKCMHAFIGKDINGQVAVAHTLPYNVASWGCGSGSRGSYNRDPVGHIQFEICEDGLHNEAYYREAFGAAEEYCATLCRQFGFDPMQITSHYEAARLGYASNHGDPWHWMRRFGDSMDAFRQRVAARMGQPVETVSSVLQVIKGQPLIRRQDVRDIQNKLIALGYSVGVKGADGVYGHDTADAVRRFQRDAGIPEDGIVSASTRAAILSAVPAPYYIVTIGPVSAAKRDALLKAYPQARVEQMREGRNPAP